MIDVDAVTLFLALLAVTAQLTVATTAGLVVVRPVPIATDLLDDVRDAVAGRGPQLALVVAGIATAGSLYFSEVAGFVPCRLCWYQRAAMYPLVPLLAMALVRPQWRLWRVAVPLAAIGACISTYHVVLERFPSLESGACALDNPCSLRWVEELGFVTIPVMALSAFLLVLTALLLDPRKRSDQP